MKLLYFKGKHPNFGDDLNAWLLPRLLPDFFDEDEKDVFVGIGSILGADFVQKYGKESRKIVFGSGFVPSYHEKPDLRGDDWDVRFVRGPRTTASLGLSPDLALGDAAVLVRLFVKRADHPSSISFIPHWESLDRGHWEEACRLAGVNLIDPRQDVETVLNAIAESKFVITEAMHGAIVADALRVPWIPVIPTNKVHRDKWFDWAEAFKISLKPRTLFPSSLLEARLSVLRRPLMSSPLAAPIEKAMPHLAAFRLRQLLRAQPSLSEEAVLVGICDKMLEHIEKLKRHI